MLHPQPLQYVGGILSDDLYASLVLWKKHRIPQRASGKGFPILLFGKIEDHPHVSLSKSHAVQGILQIIKANALDLIPRDLTIAVGNALFVYGNRDPRAEHGSSPKTPKTEDCKGFYEKHKNTTYKDVLCEKSDKN